MPAPSSVAEMPDFMKGTPAPEATPPAAPAATPTGPVAAEGTPPANVAPAAAPATPAPAAAPAPAVQTPTPAVQAPAPAAPAPAAEPAPATPRIPQEFKMPDSLASLMTTPATPATEPAPAPAAAPAPQHTYANDEARQIAVFYQNGGTTQEYNDYRFAKDAASMSELEVSVAEIQRSNPGVGREAILRSIEARVGGTVEARTVKGPDGQDRQLMVDPNAVGGLKIYANQARERLKENIAAFEQKAGNESATPDAEQMATAAAQREGAAPLRVERPAGQPGGENAVAAIPAEQAVRVARDLISTNRDLVFDLGKAGEAQQLIGKISDDMVDQMESGVASYVQQEIQRLGGLNPGNYKDFQSSVSQFTKNLYTVLNPNFLQDIYTSGVQLGQKNAVSADNGLSGRLFGAGGSTPTVRGNQPARGPETDDQFYGRMATEGLPSTMRGGARR